MHTAIWFTTRRCNYKCPYCWEGDSRMVHTETADNREDRWTKAWTKLNPKVLDITGGEPMMLPWLVDMMAALPESIKFGFTTNLSMSLFDLIKKVPASRFVGFTCSWHPTQRMCMDMFLAKCKLLQERGYPVTVNFVTYPEQVHLLDHYATIFHNWGLRYHVDPYGPLNVTRNIELTPAEQNMVARYVKADRLPDPLVMQYGSSYTVACNAGKEYICVQPDGNAYRCVTWFTKNTPAIGNVLDPEFKLAADAAPCQSHWHCAGCDRDKITATFLSSP